MVWCSFWLCWYLFGIFVILEAVSVACFLLRWPMCQEDRAGLCLSTGCGSVSGLEIFVCYPPDMVSSGLRQLPQLSFYSSVMMLSIHQSRPICLGPLSTCKTPPRNEERTLWKIGSDGLPSLSLQPVLGAARVFNTLSPVCLGMTVDSQDSLADSWVYFIQGTFCTYGVTPGRRF